MRQKVHYFLINSQSGHASSQAVGPEPYESAPAAMHRMHKLDIQATHVVREALADSQSQAISPGFQ